MKAEKREEGEEVYPQITQIHTDKRTLSSKSVSICVICGWFSFSSWCLDGSFSLLRSEWLRGFYDLELR
jgi:hypothetical protein